MILPQCPTLRIQVLQHLAHSTKATEQLLDPQVLKIIIKKVTFIGLVSNSYHSTQKGRFKLSCLDILNYFCHMLLTLHLICALKVSSEHKMTLAGCTSLNICYKKCLWFPHFLCIVMALCKMLKLLDNGYLISLNGSKL